MKLAGKVALVTGGSQGIGAAISRRFAAEGAAIAIVNRANAAAAGALVREIAASGGRADHVQADIRRVAEVERAVRWALDEASDTSGRVP